MCLPACHLFIILKSIWMGNTLTGGSITYIDETITLFAGMSFNDCLDYLYDGEYILTLSTDNGIIDQYLITVKSD